MATRSISTIIPLIGTLKGYSLSAFRDDLFAGVVVAALTIPLSMGYAEVAGVPAEYGLYAAMLTATLFALFTRSRNIVFGMDSATAAVTGSAIANLGVAWGSAQAAEAMPFLALVTAAFVGLFFFLKLGKFAEKVPSPVMHGFILGIALVVIIGQLPKLLGLSVPGTSAPEKLVGCIAQITDVSILAIALAVFSIAAILLVEKKFPRVPIAMLVLIAGTLFAAVAGMVGASVPTLEGLKSGIPVFTPPIVPHGDFFGALNIIADAFTIAFVLSLESLLCFRTLAGGDASSKQPNEGEEMNRELGVAALANGVGALFACPPSAASLSRTASAIESGGRTQVASLIAALIVLLVALFLSPVMAIIPEAVLGAIVFCAIVKLPDFTKIKRYFKHMKVEFATVMTVAAIVFVFGAAYGILIGLCATVISDTIRKTGRASRMAVFGVLPHDDEPNRSQLRKQLTNDERVQAANYVKMTFGNRLVFSNASDKTDKAYEILSRIPIEAPLVLGLSKLRMVDASANDEILELIDVERARGRKVYCIRKLALANDSYTRYELRRVFGRCDDIFASKREYELTAMEDILRRKLGKKPVLNEKTGDELADNESAEESFVEESAKFSLPDERPIFTLFITAQHEAVKGALVYINSKETIRFIANVEEVEPGKVQVTQLKLNRKRGNRALGTYSDGKWSDRAMSKSDLKSLFTMISTAISYPVFLEEFDGIELEEPFGNEFEL